ncbi:hypothetical protein GCM10009416_46620 [Craurococcus roseus]|uniref:Sensor domain-containing protein n=1 Tax=Craurococcus roseus TaxID=77585 RepID=A0ABP3RBJ7_9PROT
MTNADRLQRWNQLYDRTPERWRFQVAVWALVAVGAVNMLLTIAVGFPFALLLGLAILAMAAVRVPYALGWLRTEGDAAGGGDRARMEIEAPSWMIRVNRWYDGLDETQRPLVLLAALAIPGAINMLLTFAGGFPFGLLFLLAVLALVVIRAPYTAGWYKEPQSSAGDPALGVEPAAPRIGDESAQNSFGATPRAAEGAAAAAEPPAQQQRSAKARPNGGAAAAATPANTQN